MTGMKAGCSCAGVQPWRYGGGGRRSEAQPWRHGGQGRWSASQPWRCGGVEVWRGGEGGRICGRVVQRNVVFPDRDAVDHACSAAPILTPPPCAFVRNPPRLPPQHPTPASRHQRPHPHKPLRQAGGIDCVCVCSPPHLLPPRPPPSHHPRPHTFPCQAGGIVFSDGNAANYARYAAPSHANLYARRVDYISAACLLMRRETYFQLGGFDPRYERGYYEDTDLAMAVANASRFVVYQPAAVVYHQVWGVPRRVCFTPRLQVFGWG
eukprot:56430-Chlamydomonas_euryale.AAC.1